MACVNYRSVDPRRERIYSNVQYPHYSHYTTPSFTPRIKSPRSETHGYGSYSGWMSPAYSTSGTETSREGRGDPAFPDMNMHASTYKSNAYEMTKQQVSSACSVLSMEKIQTRLKFLEDSNTVMQTRNQNLIAENKALRSRLDEEVGKSVELEGKVNALQLDLRRERETLQEERTERKRDTKESATSPDVIAQIDRPVQVWAVCRACQKKLENCSNVHSSVTISKSELDILERDMQTLRDAVIAREEAWDKAMERERAYHQQLTRLTAEAITARHLSESRLEELQTTLDALTDKESELKSAQKEILHANKIIVKLNKRFRDFEESTGNALNSEISEKDQRFIEEIVRRTSSVKGKRKVKSRADSAKSSLSSAQQDSPRSNKSPRRGDLPASSPDNVQ